MTIKKAVKKSTADASISDIDRVINAGSPPPQSEPEKTEVKFQMIVPADLCELIDEARKLTKTSRRAWLLQAAQEKLEREGKL